MLKLQVNRSQSKVLGFKMDNKDQAVISLLVCRIVFEEVPNLNANPAEARSLAPTFLFLPSH